MSAAIRTCPGCGLGFAMCRCCLPPAPNEVTLKHVTEQAWVPEVREDGVYLVAADDHTVVLKLCRPDRDSDLLMAGYIAGLQGLRRFT